ncbi:MAG: Sugar phosphate isomerase/epimerase [Verrucomicrobia bacterium]|nr:MAG: Sugar phosphate isomerase/epimerase [Verrucomicrobiota bacterium]
MKSRREFLQTLPLGGLWAMPGFATEEKFRIVTFTKSFQDLSHEALSDAIAGTGLDGIEVAVRPKGHIEPDRVEEELPKLVTALRARNLVLEVMTSGINQISREQRTESILRAAAGLGIPRYRLAYYKYDLGRPVRAQLDEIRPRLADLAALNKELGIQGVYQNHAGRDYVGAPVWDMHDLVRDLDPAAMAIAFDIGHATVEGASSWEIDFQLCRPNLGIVYVKDYLVNGRTKQGVPLGQGGVDPKFFAMLAGLSPRLPISLHVEYIPDEAPGPERTRKHLEAIRRDLGTLRGLLAS